jgi:hypothetical protein
LVAHHGVTVRYEAMPPSILADWDSAARVLRVDRDVAAHDQLWALTELCIYLMTGTSGSTRKKSVE